MDREREPASNLRPQLQGVVIISLPPPDDPFKGKTITAFTLSDSPLPQSHPPPHPHPQRRDSLPSRSPTPISRRSLLSPKKVLAAFLGASLLAFSLWACLFAEEPLQLLGENEENGRRCNESRSFLFPLYSKSRGRVLREVGEVKLASLKIQDGAEVQPAKRSSKPAASSSARFPVGGNVFPDGCAYDQQGQLLASPAKTDGILGLGSAKISLPSQLANQGIISNVVGHCFTSEADGGGYLFFGDDFVPRWGMTWVPILDGLTNYYHTGVRKISYGDQQLNVRRKGGDVIQVVFDSGSSYTYFPNDAYASLVASLKYVSHGLVQDDSDPLLPICWRANFPVRSLKDVKQFFEPVTLQFEKKWWVMSRTFSIPPEGYLIINIYLCVGSWLCMITCSKKLDGFSQTALNHKDRGDFLSLSEMH